MSLAFCRKPRATFTLARRIPSICARNSWVRRTWSPPNRSWLINNHLANRWLALCSRLHAAICADCTATSCPTCARLFRSAGQTVKTEIKFLALIRYPLPATWTITRVALVLSPATSAGKPDFHKLAVPEDREDRRQSVTQEVAISDRLRGLIQNRMQRQWYQFQFWGNGFEFLAG